VTSPIGVIIKQVFIGWSGDSMTTTPTATIIMDNPKVVIANLRTDYTQLHILLGAIAISVATAILLINIRKKGLRSKCKIATLNYKMSLHN
jgi:hypothetical protein